jgi:hypothetical protein
MKGDLHFIMYMDASLMIILLGFNIWNWFLCLTGFTTIEFFRRQGRFDDEDMFDFSFETVRDNLFVIFGTTKPLRILSPSLRALPFNGTEWSFMLKDLGYSEEGIKDAKFDEEMPVQSEESKNVEMISIVKQQTSVLTEEFDSIESDILI